MLYGFIVVAPWGDDEACRLGTTASVQKEVISWH